MKNKAIDFIDNDNYAKENEMNYKLGIYEGVMKAQLNAYDDGFRQGTEVK